MWAVLKLEPTVAQECGSCMSRPTLSIDMFILFSFFYLFYEEELISLGLPTPQAGPEHLNLGLVSFPACMIQTVPTIRNANFSSVIAWPLTASKDASLDPLSTLLAACVT